MSTIDYFEELDPPRSQPGFHVFENVFMVKARGIAEARRRGMKFARAGAALKDETLTVDGRPARIVFGGIRKIVECFGDPTSFRPAEVRRMRDGVEATYSEFLVPDRQELRNLIAGRPATVVYRR